MTSSATLEITLQNVPSKPGCYLMKDKAGRVIYVGKAVNLRNRTRSYFQPSAVHTRRVGEMVDHVRDLEWIVVGSELEALILEMNLIKRHRPKYNVRLKDDKRYPYIKVHWADPFPKVTVTRRLVDDGSRYYGPYTSVWAVHQTLDVLRKIFPYLTCDRTITGEDTRACLYYDIKLCQAPCIGVVDREEYRAMIQDLCRFLQGHSEPIVERLETRMMAASEAMEYEKAATIRDQLTAIEKVVEGQRVVSRKRIDSDVIAFAREKGDACVQVFFVRAGRLIGREYFVLEGTSTAEDAEVLESFIKQFYDEAPFVPQRVLLPEEVEEARIIESWLSGRKPGQQKVKLVVPRRGINRELVDLAAENAADTLAMLRSRWEADRTRQVKALSELKEALHLPGPPNRIECYDISNLQGTAAAGSMVVFEEGVPSKRFYRKFNIKSVQGQDDFASMEEVLRRRLRRYRLAQETADQPGGKLDRAFGLLPDLLVVDGGKGQLNRATKVVEAAGLQDEVQLAALAKAFEDIYLPGWSEPVRLPRASAGLHLIQRLRDEAHRFAVSHHRVRRSKTMRSMLESVPGIGPARRRALLQSFGDLTKLKQAPVEDLAQVPGISRELAQRVKNSL